jgi:hypothetical protein
MPRTGVDHARRGNFGEPLATAECRVCGLDSDPYEQDYGICVQCQSSRDPATKAAVAALMERDRRAGAR